MEIIYPDYFNSFRCLAAACPDSCCKEWEVGVDAKSAEYYRTLPGALGDRLRQVLQDTDSGTTMRIENGRCPMWQQDGLCRIQAELGHDALCQTCRDFPRIRHDYGSFVEWSLELSCPEAARLILSCENSSTTTTSYPGGEIPDYEIRTMDILRRSRTETLAFLDDTPCSIPETLAIILLYSHFVQAEIDGGEAIPFCHKQLLTQAKSFPKANNIDAVLTFFSQLEMLTDQWRSRLAEPANAPQWTPEHKAMARYLIQRYWLQAVSDYDLVCRVKFIISACILVAALGGNTLQTAQLFSKEVENNPDNIDTILDAAYTSPAFTDANLFGILLS